MLYLNNVDGTVSKTIDICAMCCRAVLKISVCVLPFYGIYQNGGCAGTCRSAHYTSSFQSG